MPAARRLTIEQQRAMKRRLDDARESLDAYLDPDNQNCAVPRDARVASESYLYTWVQMQIEGALNTLNLMLGEES
jgi:hypothetical protein